MRTAYWTHKDEEREIDYETILHFEVDENEIVIRTVELESVIDWSYDRKQGAVVAYPLGDDAAMVRGWLLKQARGSESAEEACREEYEEHLEILREQAQGII